MPTKPDSPQADLNVGDIVKLRSGSPKMTVSGVNGETVSVTWAPFPDGPLARAHFARPMIVKVDA